MNDAVEANFKGRGNWYGGKITKVDVQDGILIYSVHYNDGDQEKSILEDCIRIPPVTKVST